MLAFSAAGLFVGLAVGVTGVGGGSLMTPLLILLFGFSPSAAVGTDLLYAAGTKGFGTWLHGRQQTVDWRVVGLMASGSLPAAVVTILWLHLVGLEPWVEELMTVTLCLAIITTAVLTLLRRHILRYLTRDGTLEESGLPASMHRWREPVTVVGGVVLGALVTLSSVGAGVLGTTLLLLLYPRLAAIRVVGTDIAHAVPLTLVAGLGHLSLGTTDLAVLAFLMLGSLPGIYLGTRLGSRLPDGLLRPIISVLLLVVAVSMLFDSVRTLTAAG
ncbi:sulfite exporter TauE/SafE family protein [Salinisphaera orenii]|uniref:Probable membrane transporter protein n=1 Tax=Salinisphaera orenii YIM 95161 TaxID=1051139 RepID=A0A423PSR9_9GAMM|nr:sulfite exporter TauE/SafE family protein [Salinisphaera halophila]ROO28650.1 membrane protein [Salinisphaera halophila YIM 95161]